jgi:hypothetical protein
MSTEHPVEFETKTYAIPWKFFGRLAPDFSLRDITETNQKEGVVVELDDEEDDDLSDEGFNEYMNMTVSTCIVLY